VISNEMPKSRRSRYRPTEHIPRSWLNAANPRRMRSPKGMDRRLKEVRHWEKTKASLLESIPNPSLEYIELAEEATDLEFKLTLMLQGWARQRISVDAYERLRAAQNRFFKVLNILRRASLGRSMGFSDRLDSP